MLFVIDSNEFILALGPFPETSPKVLLDLLLQSFPSHSVRIPRNIVEEVRKHLTVETFREFIAFITSLTSVDEDFVVPFELGAKYESKGLKPSDAFIAAYAEYVGADFLVTENRHFLNLHTHLPFHIVTASNCLKLLEAGR